LRKIYKKKLLTKKREKASAAQRADVAVPNVDPAAPALSATALACESGHTLDAPAARLGFPKALLPHHRVGVLKEKGNESV